MKFSIIVPLYNKEKYILRTIDSILSQTYQKFELIIVNDGSTDNSLNEAKKRECPQVRIIDKKNGGVSSARNRGISEAKNEWIVFFDADDIMYPNALAEYVALHQQFPDTKVLCASIDASTAKYPSTQRKYLIKNYQKANIYSELRTGFSLLCTDCICIHEECFKRLGGFSENYTHGEDLDMWCRLGEYYMFAKSEVCVAYYDYDTENRSSDVTKSNRHYAPATGIKMTPPRISEPFYIKVIFGSKVYTHSIDFTGTELSLIQRIKISCYLFLFLFSKMLFKIGICNSRGAV